MEIGQMDRRIVLSDYSLTRNEFGEAVETYTTTATVWAAVRHGSGNERMVAGKNSAVGDAIFTIRFRSGITEKTRITWDGINWDIQHISYLGRRQFVDIIAKKVV